MKKILFITTRNPFSTRFSGDVIGSKKIINTLKKNNLLDVVALGKKEDFSQKNIFIFREPIKLLKIFYVIKSLIYMQPLQFGLFYSGKMKKFIIDRALDYDVIFCYHIRSIQYLPEHFYGKKIIEMGDLISDNYKQTFYSLNILNPLKYIFFLESFFVKNIEKNILINFDKIILFSKNEIKKIDKLFLKKIVHINVSIDQIKRKYFFSKDNSKILFIGNLKYLPNILAVKSFIIETLPKLREKIPNIKFEVIGEISSFNKFLLSFYKSVKFRGVQKNLDKFIKGSICGLANLKIATGIQGKILTYMSYGLPVICSNKASQNFNKSVISYTENHNLINIIVKLKDNKKISNQISKKSIKFIKNYSWKKIEKQYIKII
tara:strand:+ start:5959 stop:7086 length:1128 start_codon:yes stop_codon:yes gene_type:complete